MKTLGRSAAVLGLCWILSGCQETLYSGLSEPEANLMRQTLMQRGIDASKRVGDDGKHALEIDRADVTRALQVLQAAGLPRNKFASTIEVLKTDALVASPAEDRARLSYALSQELASTLSAIDGVVTARVHLVLPDRPALAISKSAAPSASVFIKHRPGYNLQASVMSVRQLVARSVEGLAPEQVSVVMWPAEREEALPEGVPQRAAPAQPWLQPLLLVLAAAAGLLGGLWLQGRHLPVPAGASPASGPPPSWWARLQRLRSLPSKRVA